MTTFVLVHGGGHGGWCYDAVSSRLRAAGHLVHAPSLSGCGERSHRVAPDIDLDSHVEDVRALLHWYDLHDVVLVGHSYGGMVITGAGGRAADRIGKLVYLDAATPRNGESLVDHSGPVINAVRPMGKVVDGVELVLWPDPEAGRFYGVEDPDDLAWMAERLTPHPWRCFDTPVRIDDEAAFAAIPQYHVVCTDTIPGRPRRVIERARAEGRFWDVDTGHDLMITEPDRVTEILLEIAADVP